VPPLQRKRTNHSTLILEKEFAHNQPLRCNIRI